MDFRQLRTFSCVAELGSLSKASDTLRVAQPALSRQIKLLEHELRVELFTRNGRGMVLTDAGRLLLARGCGLARKKSVDVGWLLRQRLVLPSHSHGLRALIEHAAAQRKIKLNVQLEADSFRVLTSLVEEGLGFALLPPSSVHGEVADGR